ncbi:hypothetical protein [Frankia sp. Cj5]|uniref:hypothetical protein n=1 Tax=Frankia sp. Cj5 TaxID=2880978 RepID=UPI001EF6FC4E|nr:hypothetical protein [Frankia sp. Cj5]
MAELPMFVGSSDIAAALGVTRQAVDHRLRTDPRAPVPVAVVNRTATWGGTRVWRRTEIDRWLGGLAPDRWIANPGATRRATDNGGVAYRRDGGAER